MAKTATPLASPTIALLYLRQGHVARARKTVNAVLEAEPDNGYALALRHRLDPSGTLSLGFSQGQLKARWRITPYAFEAGRTHLVVVTWGLAEPGAASATTAPYVRSLRCAARQAEHSLDLPTSYGSATASVVHSTPTNPQLRVLACSDVVSWPVEAGSSDPPPVPPPDPSPDLPPDPRE